MNEEVLIRRVIANSISETRYIGKICEIHPELKGERLKRNWRCPACCEVKSETRYIGKVCDKHPKLKGERLKSNYQCPACYRAKQKIELKVKRAAKRAAELKADQDTYSRESYEKRILMGISRSD